jgi:zinc transport system substrate-binding protein
MGKLITVVLLLIFIMSISVFTGCSSTPPQPGNTLNIVVTIQPQLEFAGKVGGDKVTVAAMVPPGADPHTYEPLPSQITNLATANIYAELGSGIEFELAWLDKLKSVNDKMLIVDCATGIKLIETAEEPEESQTAPEEELQGNQHGAVDPHIWMSPANAIIISQNILNGLETLDPENKVYYENNFQGYKQQLLTLDTYIRDSLKNIDNRAFLVDHPAFSYFASDYNLDMLAIQEEGKEPSAADVTRLIETAKQKNIRIVIISPEFNPQSAKVIAKELGAKIITVDVLSSDYLENMRYFVNELINSLK